MLLSLSGLDASWPMHEQYGLPLERIPDVIANTVQLVIEDLRGQANPSHRPERSRTPSKDHERQPMLLVPGC